MVIVAGMKKGKYPNKTNILNDYIVVYSGKEH